MILIIILFLLCLFSIYFLSNAKRSHTLFGRISKEFLIALVIWGFAMFWMMMFKGALPGLPFFLLMWFVIPYGYFLFMVNRYWLLKETEKRNNRKIIFYLARLIPLIILFSPVLSMFFKQGGREIMTTQAYLLTLFAMTVISIALAWFIYSRDKEKIQQLSALRKALGKSTANIQSLRSQINPHFLFNALNTLYGLAIRENAAKTGDGIQKLGDMMRFMLQDNQKDLIPLASEMSYLKDYIYLQQLRLEESEDIQLKINISEPSQEYFIAPMLLIPFVENAFKHGIRLQEKSWISIDLSYNDGCLKYEVHNSLHHKITPDAEKKNTGIGLENVKERLNLLCPDKYKLTVSENENEYIINLSLPLEHNKQ